MMTAHIPPKVFKIALRDMIEIIKVKMMAGWYPGENFAVERTITLGPIDAEEEENIPQIIMHFRYQVGDDPGVREKMFLKYVELKHKNPDKIIMTPILYTGTDKYSFNPEYAPGEKLPETEYEHNIAGITFPVLDLGEYEIELAVKTKNPELIGIIPALDRGKRKNDPEGFLKEITEVLKDYILLYPEKRHDILEDTIFVALLIWQRDSEPIREAFKKELFDFLSKRDRKFCEVLLDMHDKEVWELLADRTKKFWEMF